jgi:hypothetical protein
MFISIPERTARRAAGAGGSFSLYFPSGFPSDTALSLLFSFSVRHGAVVALLFFRQTQHCLFSSLFPSDTALPLLFSFSERDAAAFILL